MNSDNHEIFRHLLDESLARGMTVDENESLRQHLQSCAPCQQYADTTARVIAGLSGFSFEVDGALNAKVCASVRARAEQLKATQLSRPRLAMILLLAVVLTALGSFVELQFGGAVALFFAVQREQVQHELLNFWILPSLCLLMLFPLLPLLSKRREKVI